LHHTFYCGLDKTRSADNAIEHWQWNGISDQKLRHALLFPILVPRRIIAIMLPCRASGISDFGYPSRYRRLVEKIPGDMVFDGVEIVCERGSWSKRIARYVAEPIFSS
jgi:hypothetical protein